MKVLSKVTNLLKINKIRAGSGMGASQLSEGNRQGKEHEYCICISQGGLWLK